MIDAGIAASLGLLTELSSFAIDTPLARPKSVRVHELALTESVVATIRERLPDARVTRVRLQIGRLTAVVPDALRFCFDICVAGTPLEGAALEIEQLAARGRCRTCGRADTIDEVVALCACGSPDVELLQGRELLIKHVEVA